MIISRLGRGWINEGYQNFSKGNGESPKCFCCKKHGHVEKDYWYKNENPNPSSYGNWKKLLMMKKKIIDSKPNIRPTFLKKQLLVKSGTGKLVFLMHWDQNALVIGSNCSQRRTGDKTLFFKLDELWTRKLKWVMIIMFKCEERVQW